MDLKTWCADQLFGVLFSYSGIAEAEQRRAVFAHLWLCSCRILRRAQINSRGQKFTSSLRGTRPHDLLFTGWHQPIPPLKRNTRFWHPCVFLFFFNWLKYFPTVKYVCSLPVKILQQEKIHTLIHLLAPPFEQAHAKKKQKKNEKNMQLWRISKAEKALVHFHKAF